MFKQTLIERERMDPELRELKSLEEEEMKSAILSLKERVTTLEQATAVASSGCSCSDRLAALEERLAALEATCASSTSASSCCPTMPKMRMVSLNFDTYGPDAILNEQGPYRDALSYGSDVIVRVTSTQEVVRFCSDWTAPVGTVLRVLCDAPLLHFEGEGWAVLYEISQGESYTFVKEEDGWKGYSGILLL